MARAHRFHARSPTPDRGRPRRSARRAFSIRRSRRRRCHERRRDRGLDRVAPSFAGAAAGVGLLLNLVLFLTNSWKTHPYFLGSDIVFVFAWLPLVLAGADGQPALDTALDRLAAAREVRARSTRGGPRAAPSLDPELTRRMLLSRALAASGVATLALGGTATLLKGSYRSTTRVLSTGSRLTTSGNGGGHTSAASQAPSQSSGVPPFPAGTVKLGASTGLPRGQRATYTDPGDGQPDILIRQTDGTLTALSAVCTHQACTVGYA
jgi:thiosulfate dehydrogenase [quinone] large subunit